MLALTIFSFIHPLKSSLKKWGQQDELGHSMPRLTNWLWAPKSTQSKEIANFCHQVVLWPQHVAWYACVPSRRYTKQMSFKLLNWAWRDSLVGKDPSMHPPPPARQAWWAEFIPRFHVWSFHLSVYSVACTNTHRGTCLKGCTPTYTF